MKHAQYNKATGKIINLLEISNGYIFDGNYGWQNADNYLVTIGDYFTNDTFYKEDRTTVINKTLTFEETISPIVYDTQSLIQQHDIVELEIYETQAAQDISILEIHEILGGLV